MACFHPINGYVKRSGGFTTNKGQAYGDLKLSIACGRCTGCRIDKSTAWAVRCVHEAQMHKKNCFITLTYDPANLPHPPSLNTREIQLFMSRLRRHYHPKKIRFFASGEYGHKDNTERPHYHLLLFGHDFDDKVLCREGQNQANGYHSETLDKIWGKGRTETSNLTFNSAGYVARYALKKINGDMAEKYYQRTDEYGEIYDLLPEFALMSRMPGIGYSWLEKYASDIFPCDHVIIDGKKKPVPSYYFRMLEESGAQSTHRKIQLKRRGNLRHHKDDNTPARLKVREKCLKLKQHQRQLK